MATSLPWRLAVIRIGEPSSVASIAFCSRWLRIVSTRLISALAIKPGDKPLVLVTHQEMVTAITGVYPQSGEAVVVAPARTGGKAGVKVIGSVQPDVAK